MQEKSRIVSFDNEPLILVDRHDKVLGYKTKVECHKGTGILHRAFSIFIFDSRKQLLIQQRSMQKLLWPLFWSNSCCSHPRKGETYEDAVNRRLLEELGIETQLVYLYKFVYQARFENIGSEYELCSVYLGSSDQPPVVNPNEIADWKYIAPEQLDEHMALNPDDYSPWFKMEWHSIRTEYIDRFEKFLSSPDAKNSKR
jgi:isopentenyl-diphosphate delta-isomerase